MSVRPLGLALGLVALWCALLASAIGSVYAKHAARQTFAALRALETERDQLEIDWGRLRIEQSAWATHARVEQLAREELDMIVPRAEDVAVLRQ